MVLDDNQLYLDYYLWYKQLSLFLYYYILDLPIDFVGNKFHKNDIFDGNKVYRI